MNVSEIHDLQRYLTPREAAAYLCVSKSFLDKLRVSGGGPKFIKVGNRVRYRVECLDAWMLAREFINTSEASANLAA